MISFPRYAALTFFTLALAFSISGESIKVGVFDQWIADYPVETTDLPETPKAPNLSKLKVTDGLGRQWGVEAVRGSALDTEGKVWFAVPAGIARETEKGWVFYTGAEGLPYNDFTCIAASPDGAMWFGTAIGAIRLDPETMKWDYFQGKAWLPGDKVRNIAVDENGNAYCETDKGVGAIKKKPMTLAEKAQYYEEEIEIIKRTEYGYVSEVSLKDPNNKKEVVYHSSDNDGLWTAMYGAGECFAYGATKDPKAKVRAKQAFEALRFLGEVTQCGSHPAPKGFVARSILPTDGPDPNIGRMAQDQITHDTEERLWKVYEPRWPVSADGKWYWKSDTSSDELDGHYFFYPAYYDLVADTDQEKERVRTVVRDMTDHLIAHGYNFVDHTGTPTRWGIYNPDDLNKNPDWWEERGLKSLSLLSYLTVAEHMTGDAKYAQHIRKLIDEDGFLINAMIAKQHFGPGSGNQSDDEMAIMNYYNLLKYSQLPEIQNMLGYSFHKHWTLVQPEMNPFFNFAYASWGQNKIHTDVWYDHKIGPWNGWLQDSVETLKEFPLDRRSWGHRNSHRTDLVLLRRQDDIFAYIDEWKGGRGYRNNGKCLSVANRFFHHWNTDPWRLDYGGDGRSLASGTVYLLGYYMGVYHGFITE